MLKQTLIAGAALALAAVPAFAWGGFTVNHVSNHAYVHNTTVTVANTGLNFTGTTNNGNTTGNANVTTGETEHVGHTGSVNGGLVSGGANSSVTTGNAFAGSFVSNDVNTTIVRQ